VTVRKTDPSGSEALKQQDGASKDTSAKKYGEGPEIIGGTGLNRTQALMMIPRACAENLQGGAERPISEIASQLHAGVDSSMFMRMAERRLELNVPAELKKFLFQEGQGRQAMLDDLRKAAHTIIDAAVPHFEAQQRSGKLKPQEMNLHIVFTIAKISKPAMDAFADRHMTDEKRRPQLIGCVRLALKEALQAALVQSAETVRETPQQRGAVLVGLFAPRFLIRTKEELPAEPRAGKASLRSPAEVLDVVRIGRVAHQQDPETLLSFLEAIEQVPAFRATLVRRDFEQRSRLRMQRALAELIVSYPQDPIGEAHFQTVDTIRQMYGSTAVLFHPYRRDNDSAVVDALYRGFKRGDLTLSFASCPNYSGATEIDSSTGKQQWRYDFAQLGRDAGVVAERGLEFVSEWVRVLKPKLGDGLRLVHWEGTFEIAKGFKSSKESAFDLSYPDALEQLRASGEAVKTIYAARGIELLSRLTCEVIPDESFTAEKERSAEVMRGKIQEIPSWARIAEEIFVGRQGLYEAWFPRGQEEELESYAARVKSRVVPENIAEYLLLGGILTGAGQSGSTLVLAYDSPWMGEVYAQEKMPVISGQGARALGYLGA
jgi:hypothetical protein